MTQHSASSSWFGMRRSTWLALLCAAAAASVSAPAVHNRAHAADAAPAAQTEFGGQCVEALAESQHVSTNCTTTWTDKDGKVYCFSNDGAKKTFLANPAENLQRARSFMAASNVESTEKAMQDFTSSDAETLVKAVIADKVKANNGIFPFDDPLNGEHLKLSYDDVDFTRTIDGYGFFPDVKFHDSQDAKKKYLIDFWVVPEGGKLLVQETRIYKEPLKVEGNWTTMARQPVPWWWIPASRRRPLLCVHRLPGRRHQGPDLRHRFLGQRQRRRDERRSDQGPQSARTQERSVDPGAALRMEGRRHVARRAVNRAGHLMWRELATSPFK